MLFIHCFRGITVGIKTGTVSSDQMHPQWPLFQGKKSATLKCSGAGAGRAPTSKDHSKTLLEKPWPVTACRRLGLRQHQIWLRIAARRHPQGKERWARPGGVCRGGVLLRLPLQAALPDTVIRSLFVSGWDVGLGRQHHGERRAVAWRLAMPDLSHQLAADTHTHTRDEALEDPLLVTWDEHLIVMTLPYTNKWQVWLIKQEKSGL
jgi:hypothetical protein